jgi:HK97 gp10 family phage protein
MRIEMEGWDKIDEAFGGVLAALEGDDLFDVLNGGAAQLLRISQQNAPVDTGFLRSSGQLDREGDTPLVGYAAEYSEHVEYGTSNMAAQPFLRPAMQETDELVAAMSKVHKSKLDDVSEGA